MGVPPIIKTPLAADCDALIDKVAARIESWLSKNLTFASRLQLISSVLYILQVYWTSIFILPKKVIRMLEQKLNRLRWSGNANNQAQAKVAWNYVCVPKQEGGLGIKKLEDWNKASILRHICNLFARAGSLWVAWVKEYLLEGKSFWEVKTPHQCSWCWRKMLQLRGIARGFIQYKVGDGNDIFMWLDSWQPDGVLLDKHGFRVVYDTGRRIQTLISLER